MCRCVCGCIGGIGDRHERRTDDPLPEAIAAPDLVDDLAVGPVYKTEEVIHDAAFVQSGMLLNLKHSEVGERAVPGLPVSFSAIDLKYTPAPAMGENTDEVLRELLGYSDDRIASLRQANVLL